MISSSIRELSWMHQPNPGEFMLASQNSARALGATLNESLARGQQNSQFNKQHAMDMKEQGAMLPIKQQLGELQVQSQAADLTTKLNSISDRTATKTGAAALSEAMAAGAGQYTSPEWQKNFYSIGKTHPEIVGSPMWNAAETRMKVAGEMDFKLNKLESDAMIKEQAYHLQNLRLQEMTKQRELDRTSRETIASENNKTQLENTVLKFKDESREWLNRADHSTMLREMDVIKGDQVLTSDDKSARIKAIYDQYRQKHLQSTPGAAPAAVRKFDPATGTIK